MDLSVVLGSCFFRTLFLKRSCVVNEEREEEMDKLKREYGLLEEVRLDS